MPLALLILQSGVCMWFSHFADCLVACQWCFSLLLWSDFSYLHSPPTPLHPFSTYQREGLCNPAESVENPLTRGKECTGVHIEARTQKGLELAVLTFLDVQPTPLPLFSFLTEQVLFRCACSQVLCGKLIPPPAPEVNLVAFKVIPNPLQWLAHQIWANERKGEAWQGTLFIQHY